MKALTILQPWASLIACGAKKIETRSWATKYRGPLAIHAGMNDKYLREFITHEEPFRSALAPLARLCKTSDPAIRMAVTQWNHGCVIAIADLVDCVEVEKHIYSPLILGMLGRTDKPFARLVNNHYVNGNELAFGDYTPGRYAWMLENVRMIEPVPAKGMQRLWNWDMPEMQDVPGREP